MYSTVVAVNRAVALVRIEFDSLPNDFFYSDSAGGKPENVNKCKVQPSVDEV